MNSPIRASKGPNAPIVFELLRDASSHRRYPDQIQSLFRSAALPTLGGALGMLPRLLAFVGKPSRRATNDCLRQNEESRMLLHSAFCYWVRKTIARDLAAFLFVDFEVGCQLKNQVIIEVRRED